MSADFRASQIQTGKIIVTSSVGSLAVYSIDVAGTAGAITDSTVVAQISQRDTFLFVSGSSNSMRRNVKGTSVFGGDVAISGSMFVRQAVYSTPTVVTASSYGVLDSDYIIGISSSVATSIILPSPTIYQNGRLLIIKDVAGNASSHAYTIDGNGNLIDGRNKYNLLVNYQSVQLFNFGSYWSIL